MDPGFTAYSKGVYVPKKESDWSKKDKTRPIF